MSARAGYRLFTAGIGATGIGVGALLAAHWQDGPPSGSEGNVLRAVPLNLIGISAHYTASVPLPRPFRSSVYKSYCSLVGCDPEEAEGNLKDFQSLAAFFGRSLRPEVRPINTEATLVAPCDGTVVDAGPVGAYGAISVKNVPYKIRDLVGAADRERLSESSVAVADRKESGSRLWYTVIHIGPGQCHRFSSPALWAVSERRHIQGHLLWLNPAVTNLYTENERVSLLGRWDHGLFTMTAVGAAGRGSIQLNSNDECFSPLLRPSYKDIASLKYPEGQNLRPGDSLGGFRLGSAVVLVFEAPENSFQFHVRPGDSVKTGQELASVACAANASKPADSEDKPVEKRRGLDGRARFRRAW